MSAFADDRVARGLLGAAFGASALLVVVALWSVAGDAPEHWARARWTLGPLLACLVAAGACLGGAWIRRADRSRWLPLLGGALTACTAIAASLSGRL